MSNKGIALSAAAAAAITNPNETIGLALNVASGVQLVLQWTGEAVNNVVQSTTGINMAGTTPFIPLAAEAFGGATIGDYVAEKTGFNSTLGKNVFRVGFGALALTNPLVGTAAMTVSGYKLGKYTLGKAGQGLGWTWGKLRGKAVKTA